MQRLLFVVAALGWIATAAGRRTSADSGVLANPEFSRGGAGLYHSGIGPCGADPRRIACAFHDSAMAATKALQATLPAVTLDVSNVSIAQRDHVNVTVTFRHHTPTTLDWIGAYCVDDDHDPPKDREFMDYQMLTVADGSNPQDVVNIPFGPLVNMRCAWQFRFFTQRGDDAYIKLASSPFVRFAKGKYEPLHVHTAKTTARDKIRVMWVSASNANATPFVQYGVARDTLTRRAVVETRETYSASDMCEAPATTIAANLFRDPGVMFSAVLTGLKADSTYYYCVCSGNPADSTSADASPCSDIFKLKTPPAPGSQNGTASFFVYGDLGDWTVHATGPYNSRRSGTTMDLIRRDMDDPKTNYVAVLHDGDLAYGMGKTYLWDQFGALIEPVASEIPYMIGIGNHEYCYTSGGEGKDPSGAGATNGFHPAEGNYGSDSKGECGVPTNKRFIMPANGNKVFWWSTEIGLVHHTQISSEHDYRPGSEMYAWLEKDLASVDRKKTPWLVLHLHRPMYTSEAYESDNKVSIYIRKNLEFLLGKYKVDIVFSGHYHAYELTCPVFKEVCRSDPLPGGLHKAKAPVHIMVGSAGADIDNVGYYNVPWRVAAQLEYGYGRVHVHNATHAQWEFVRNRDETVASATWIISDHNWTV